MADLVKGEPDRHEREEPGGCKCVSTRNSASQTLESLREQDESEEVSDIKAVRRVAQDVLREVDGLRPDGAEQGEDTLATDPSLDTVPAEMMALAMCRSAATRRGLTKCTPSPPC